MADSVSADHASEFSAVRAVLRNLHLSRLLIALIVLASASPALAQVEWNQRTPTASPSARQGHAMAYDSARGRTVMFGGDNNDTTSGRLADTWEWDGTIWVNVTPAVSPSPRAWHAMVYDSARGRVVLFGGWNSGPYLDTWEWDGTYWRNVTPAVSPRARFMHAMVYDSARSRVVLFGGVGDPGWRSDVWEWDGTTWSEVTSAVSPPARSRHAMAYDSVRSRVVLFGGEDGFFFFGDTWEWDGATWVNVTPAVSPPSLEGHAMTYDSARGRVVLFGGSGEFSAAGLADTWTWNGTTWVNVTTAVSPPGRFFHPLVYDSARETVVMFGGCSGGISYLADTWEYGPFENLCDDLDDNANGLIDEGCDDDQDGYCDSSMTVVGSPSICPNGGSDCSDTDPTTHPGVQEICDGRDNNCDLAVDEGSPGSGQPCNSGLPGICAPGTTECQNGGIRCTPYSTGSSETCNDLDDDCNGWVDDGVWRQTLPSRLYVRMEPDATAAAILGDLDGDGRSDFAVGFPTRSPDGVDGRGEVEVRSGGTGDLLFTVTDPNGASGQSLGWAIAEIGDLNGDQTTELAIGAPGDIKDSARTGSVFVVSGATGSVIFRFSPGGNPGQRIGESVALLGDVNGDGISDFLAGAPEFTDRPPTAPGIVFVVSGADGAILKTGRITSNCTIPGARLGAQVIPVGDINSDGVRDFAASAPGCRDTTSRLRGQVFLYSGAVSDTTSPILEIWNPELEPSSTDFGEAMGLIGDVGGTYGTPDFVVADAIGGDPNSRDGVLWIYDGGTGALVRSAVTDATGLSTRLGRALAAVGDIDGDGIKDFAASAVDGVNGVTLYFSGRSAEVLLRLSQPDCGSLNCGVAMAASSFPSATNGPNLLVTGTSAYATYQVATYSDCDGDGIVGAQGDCDDTNASVYPGAPQFCDGINNNCADPLWPATPSNESDADLDGIRICQGDCDDTHSTVYPGANEVCDGLDNNCNGVSDEDAIGLDSDADGVHNACDNCRFAVNPSQADSDKDRIGNSCDNCLAMYNPGQQDGDVDQRGDICDNCPTEANTLQDDSDADRVGDVCDNCLFTPNGDQADLDTDFEGDQCDLDDGLILLDLVNPLDVEYQLEQGYDAFNIYRGALGVLRSVGQYTQDPLAVPDAAQFCYETFGSVYDSFALEAGKIVFYLVTGVGPTGESSLGTNSSGGVRPNHNPCP